MAKEDSRSDETERVFKEICSVKGGYRPSIDGFEYGAVGPQAKECRHFLEAEQDSSWIPQKEMGFSFL